MNVLILGGFEAALGRLMTFGLGAGASVVRSMLILGWDLGFGFWDFWPLSQLPRAGFFKGGAAAPPLLGRFSSADVMGGDVDAVEQCGLW